MEGALAGVSLLSSKNQHHHQPFSKIRVSIFTSFILLFKREVEKSVGELNIGRQEMNLPRGDCPFSPFFKVILAHLGVLRGFRPHS